MKKMSIGIPEYVKSDDELGQRAMKMVEIVIPEYSKVHSVWPIFGGPYIIDVQREPDGTVVITADTEGLITRARHLLTLAQEEVPVGSHLHYDTMTLEDGSLDLTLSKI